MSFGFSISDVALCARGVYNFYQCLKSAPGSCQAFAIDVLHLHHLLRELHRGLDSEWLDTVNHTLFERETDVLSHHVMQCVELLLHDIGGDWQSQRDTDWRTHPVF